MKGSVIMNNTILNEINQIEELTLEAEMNTLFALCDCYEKQAMILENTECDDLSEFSVFQEGLFEREEGESKLKTIGLLPLRIIGFMAKMFTKFVKKCRDTIRNIRLEVLLDRFAGKLADYANPNDVLDSDWFSFERRFEVKYEGDKLKCLFRPLRDPEYIQELIDDFDITDMKKIKVEKFFNMSHTFMPAKDYLKKVERICDTIENVILKQLNEQLEIFKNIGDVEVFYTQGGKKLEGVYARREVRKIELGLRHGLKLWNGLTEDISADIDACTKLYKKLEEYLNKHHVYFDGEKKKKR